MIFAIFRRNLKLTAICAVFSVLLGLLIMDYHNSDAEKWNPKPWILFAMRAFVVFLFVTYGWRDLGMLFQRPAKNMGMGIFRVWAVARTAILEAWAGRVWLLPVLWLILSAILIGTIRPFDDTERIPLYIRMLLTSQELLLIVMMWVMACVSLPRDRERKIVISNASKPLSRLEIILGKMLGFSVVAAANLLVMGVLSLIILHIADYRLRAEALEHYEIQKNDPAKTKTPQENLLQISEQGSLFAFNYITVPPEGMSILGMFRLQEQGKPPIRFLKGGSYEKVYYKFSPPRNRLYAFQDMMERPRGIRPYFEFNFPMLGESPIPVQLKVSAYRSGPYAKLPRRQERVITLNSSGRGGWEPENPEELFTVVDPQTLDPTEEYGDNGEVTVEVECPTPGVYLQVIEGVEPDNMQFQSTDFNVFARPIHGRDDAIPPNPRPIMRGFERRDRQEISAPKPEDPPGTTPELALFRFTSDVLRNVPLDNKGNFTLSLNFETYKSDNPELPTTAEIQVYSQDLGQQEPFALKVEVLEKRVMPVSIPAKFLGDPDPEKRGDMYVLVVPSTRGHSLSLLENSVRIELPRSQFFMNLFKSEFIIFLQALLVVVISVTCSIRFGWPVAMLVSSCCLLFGVFARYIQGIQEYGGLGALNYNYGGQLTGAFKFFDQMSMGVWQALAVIASLVPDFGTYDASTYIVNLQNLPWSVVAANSLETALFALPFVGIAFLLFRKQELG